MDCFGVPRCHETAGNKEKQGEKDKEIEKEKPQMQQKPPRFCGGFCWPFLTIKLGIFWDFGHFYAHQSRLQPYFYFLRSFFKSLQNTLYREAPVRFGSVTVWGWNGSSGSGFRFQRFLCKMGLSVFQYSFTGKDGSGSGFGSWKTVPAVPVPLSVSGKTVPTVPVSGSGSVPEPPWL